MSMNNISTQRLKQSLQHFFSRYASQKEEIVYAKFSPNLFTENWQKTAFYFVKDKEENKPQNKRQHPVHSLPPRERLAKYYEYLASFNEKIQHEQDSLSEAQRERLPFNRLKLEQLEQRRARCLEAIEMLEEYLIFLEKQK